MGYRPEQKQNGEAAGKRAHYVHALCCCCRIISNKTIKILPISTKAVRRRWGICTLNKCLQIRRNPRGFHILFLFWTITHFARRIALGESRNNDDLTKLQLIGIMSARHCGRTGLYVSDSFWFSAVEGEVYAMSSFFTAIVFWAILKWEHVADEPDADKWIVFIFFLMGLSIGVHLLNLLTIPAIVMVYYFRKTPAFQLCSSEKIFCALYYSRGHSCFYCGIDQCKCCAGSARGVPMDATVAGLMILGNCGRDRAFIFGGSL